MVFSESQSFFKKCQLLNSIFKSWQEIINSITVGTQSGNDVLMNHVHIVTPVIRVPLCGFLSKISFKIKVKSYKFNNSAVIFKF